MTISSFCREQLLAQGPLPIEVLAEMAVDAGTTSARDPVAAVRTAMAYKEVQLDDDRWATPLWLLEGRILTARRLPLAEGWDPAELGDAAHPWEGLCPADPDLYEFVNGSRHDVVLLDLAARSGPVPLAAGGLLRRDRYGSGWRAPQGWPGLAAGPDQLLGLRVRSGQLSVELVHVQGELLRAGAALAAELGPLDAPSRHWSPPDVRVSDNLVRALWNRMAADRTFLRSPAPPLSECVPALTSALRAAHDRRAAEATRWRPQLDLPGDLQHVAVRGARRSDHLLDEWLNAFVARSLEELEELEVEPQTAERVTTGQVVPLTRRSWR